MERLVAFFVDRSIVVHLVIIAVAALGISSIANIQKEGFPNITVKSVFISTIYPGAAAIDVEKNVTVPLEEALAEVVGIDELLSVSQDGISSIEAQIDDNASDEELKDIFNDIDTSINQVDDLPADIKSAPTLELVTSADMPIIELSFAGEMQKLREFVPFVSRRLKKVTGVSAVDEVGLPDDEVHILVNPALARRYQVGLRSIANAIGKRNMEGSGGTLESFLSEKKIVSVNKFNAYEDVLDTYLRVSDLGYAIQLKRLAKIEVVPEEMNLRVRNNGKPGVSLMIKKNARADIITTIDAVSAELQRIKIPEGIELRLLKDQSKLTRNRLGIVSSNAIVGFILVMGVLFLVFDIKIAFWTAFGIPFSFLGAFILLGFTDTTLNMLTLGGFVIVLGMLVDDAIVVAENIQAYREKGMHAREAAIEGVKEIWQPVLAASLTTICAFTPILSFGGMPGQFVFIIPLIVILALTVSLFDSYFVLPAHLYHSYAKTGKKGKGKQPKKEEKKRIVLKLEQLYQRLLEPAMKWRYAVIAGFVALLIAAVVSLALFVDKDAFPQEGSEGFTIQMTLEKGASFEATIQKVAFVEEHIADVGGDALVGFSSRLGTHSTQAATDRGSLHNIAITFVHLTSYSERDRSAQAILDAIRERAAADRGLDGVEVAFEIMRVGPPLGRAFEIRVSSNDEDARAERVQQVEKHLATLDGVFEIQDDNVEGKDELNVEMNYKTLSQAGLTIEDVLQTLRIAFDGQVVTSMVTLDKSVDFRLRLTEKSRADANFIGRLPIQNKNGNLINLAPFVKPSIRSSRGELRHVDGKRTTTVFGNLNKDKIGANEVLASVGSKFPGDEKVDISFAGEPVESGKIFGGVGAAASLAILGVYVIICLVFGSFFHPLLIIAAIPFGLIGIVFAALTHGTPFSLFAGIAMVGLTGVIVNDAIVMVHTIKKKLEEAGKKDKAKVIIAGAVARLRPVLLTTVTTILGVLPTAYGIGGLDPFISQMCLSLAYGLLFATGIILFLIPCLYAIGNDLSALAARWLPSSS